MVLHVERDRSGRRRLAEIAVLRRTGAGLVRAVSCWRSDTGPAPGVADLRRLLAGWSAS